MTSVFSVEDVIHNIFVDAESRVLAIKSIYRNLDSISPDGFSKLWLCSVKMFRSYHQYVLLSDVLSLANMIIPFIPDVIESREFWNMCNYGFRGSVEHVKLAYSMFEFGLDALRKKSGSDVVSEVDDEWQTFMQTILGLLETTPHLVMDLWDRKLAPLFSSRDLSIVPPEYYCKSPMNDISIPSLKEPLPAEWLCILLDRCFGHEEPRLRRLLVQKLFHSAYYEKPGPASSTLHPIVGLHGEVNHVFPTLSPLANASGVTSGNQMDPFCIARGEVQVGLRIPQWYVSNMCGSHLFSHLTDASAFAGSVEHMGRGLYDYLVAYGMHIHSHADGAERLSSFVEGVVFSLLQLHNNRSAVRWSIQALADLPHHLVAAGRIPPLSGGTVDPSWKGLLSVESNECSSENEANCRIHLLCARPLPSSFAGHLRALAAAHSLVSTRAAIELFYRPLTAVLAAYSTPLSVGIEETALFLSSVPSSLLSEASIAPGTSPKGLLGTLDSFSSLDSLEVVQDVVPAFPEGVWSAPGFVRTALANWLAAHTSSSCESEFQNHLEDAAAVYLHLPPRSSHSSSPSPRSGELGSVGLARLLLLGGKQQQERLVALLGAAAVRLGSPYCAPHAQLNALLALQAVGAHAHLHAQASGGAADMHLGSSICGAGVPALPGPACRPWRAEHSALLLRARLQLSRLVDKEVVRIESVSALAVGKETISGAGRLHLARETLQLVQVTPLESSDNDALDAPPDAAPSTRQSRLLESFRSVLELPGVQDTLPGVLAAMVLGLSGSKNEDYDVGTLSGLSQLAQFQYTLAPSSSVKKSFQQDEQEVDVIAGPVESIPAAVSVVAVALMRPAALVGDAYADAAATLLLRCVDRVVKGGTVLEFSHSCSVLAMLVALPRVRASADLRALLRDALRARALVAALVRYLPQRDCIFIPRGPLPLEEQKELQERLISWSQCRAHVESTRWAALSRLVTALYSSESLELIVLPSANSEENEMELLEELVDAALGGLDVAGPEALSCVLSLCGRLMALLCTSFVRHSAEEQQERRELLDRSLQRFLSAFEAPLADPDVSRRVIGAYVCAVLQPATLGVPHLWRADSFFLAHVAGAVAFFSEDFRPPFVLRMLTGRLVSTWAWLLLRSEPPSSPSSFHLKESENHFESLVAFVPIMVHLSLQREPVVLWELSAVAEPAGRAQMLAFLGLPPGLLAAEPSRHYGGESLEQLAQEASMSTAAFLEAKLAQRGSLQVTRLTVLLFFHSLSASCSSRFSASLSPSLQLGKLLLVYLARLLTAPEMLRDIVSGTPEHALRLRVLQATATLVPILRTPDAPHSKNPILAALHDRPEEAGIEEYEASAKRGWALLMALPVHSASVGPTELDLEKLPLADLEAAFVLAEPVRLAEGPAAWRQTAEAKAVLRNFPTHQIRLAACARVPPPRSLAESVQASKHPAKSKKAQGRPKTRGLPTVDLAFALEGLPSWVKGEQEIAAALLLALVGPQSRIPHVSSTRQLIELVLLRLTAAQPNLCLRGLLAAVSGRSATSPLLRKVPERSSPSPSQEQLLAWLSRPSEDVNSAAGKEDVFELINGVPCPKVEEDKDVGEDESRRCGSTTQAALQGQGLGAGPLAGGEIKAQALFSLLLVLSLVGTESAREVATQGRRDFASLHGVDPRAVAELPPAGEGLLEGPLDLGRLKSMFSPNHPDYYFANYFSNTYSGAGTAFSGPGSGDRFNAFAGYSSSNVSSEESEEDVLRRRRQHGVYCRTALLVLRALLPICAAPMGFLRALAQTTSAYVVAALFSRGGGDLVPPPLMDVFVLPLLTQLAAAPDTRVLLVKQARTLRRARESLLGGLRAMLVGPSTDLGETVPLDVYSAVLGEFRKLTWVLHHRDLVPFADTDEKGREYTSAAKAGLRVDVLDRALWGRAHPALRVSPEGIRTSVLRDARSLGANSEVHESVDVEVTEIEENGQVVENGEFPFMEAVGRDRSYQEQDRALLASLYTLTGRQAPSDAEFPPPHGIFGLDPRVFGSVSARPVRTGADSNFQRKIYSAVAASASTGAGIGDNATDGYDASALEPLRERLAQLLPSRFFATDHGTSGTAAPEEVLDSPEAMQLLMRRMDSPVLTEVNSNSGRPFQPLIIVASLVDKLPNLAGLARTAEIFGAEALVVRDSSIKDDREFQNISVTASAWVPILEVPNDVQCLLEFLRAKKAAGYTVVALEQAARSVFLGSDQCRFNEKTVLLLGAEKMGVPVLLMNEVDIVVEIPQLGLIRSLNVHVSGAMVIWEYSRQRLRQFKKMGN